VIFTVFAQDLYNAVLWLINNMMRGARPFFARLSRDALAEVGRVRGKLPEDLREAAGDVPVVCQLLPDESFLDKDETVEDLLGLFVGEAFDETGGDSPVPPQIYLFLANIWDFANGDPRVYLREVRKTYLHELGHYLGLSEGELEERGMS
jgi:predicted Zn-dependent protease with MMP-like domain